LARYGCRIKALQINGLRFENRRVGVFKELRLRAARLVTHDLYISDECVGQAKPLSALSEEPLRSRVLANIRE
jgi:hypothetical protein